MRRKVREGKGSRGKGRGSKFFRSSSVSKGCLDFSLPQLFQTMVLSILERHVYVSIQVEGWRQAIILWSVTRHFPLTLSEIGNFLRKSPFGVHRYAPYHFAINTLTLELRSPKRTEMMVSARRTTRLKERQKVRRVKINMTPSITITPILLVITEQRQSQNLVN